MLIFLAPLHFCVNVQEFHTKTIKKCFGSARSDYKWSDQQDILSYFLWRWDSYQITNYIKATKVTEWTELNLKLHAVLVFKDFVIYVCM